MGDDSEARHSPKCRMQNASNSEATGLCPDDVELKDQCMDAECSTRGDDPKVEAE